LSGTDDVPGQPVRYRLHDRLEDTVAVPLVRRDDDRTGGDADADDECGLERLPCGACCAASVAASRGRSVAGAGSSGRTSGTVQIAAGVRRR
jgi:hypothetical protein